MERRGLRGISERPDRLSYHANIRPSRSPPPAAASPPRPRPAARTPGRRAWLDAVAIGDRADERHAEAAHAPRESHHQRRHRRRADRRERLAEDHVHRQRRLQEEPADRQHDDERPARQQRRGEQERRRRRAATSAITRRGPKRSAAGPPRNPPAPLAKRYTATIAPACRRDSAAPRQHHRHERRERERRQRAQHDDEVEERQRPRVRPQRAEARRCASWCSSIGGTRVRKNAITISPGIASSGVHSRPKCCAAGAKSSGPEREAERAAGDVHRHRQSAMVAAEPMRERGRRRMKRGARRGRRRSAPRRAPARRRDADETQDRHRDHRSDHHQQPRPPAIGDVAEADLRDRRRHLVQHRQRAGGGEGEMRAWG